MSIDTVQYRYDQTPLEKRIKPILDRIHRVRDLINRAEYEEKFGISANNGETAFQFEELPAIQSDLNPECLRKNEKPILFLIGGPGSRLKSMASMIEHKYDFSVIYVGDILRNEIKSGSPLGLFIAPAVRKQELDIVVWLLKREVLNRFRCSSGLVIEGFPRTQDQLVQFEENVARAHIAFFWRVDYAALNNVLLFLRGEKGDKLLYQICVYRKYTAPILNDFGKRGKIIFGDGGAAWKLLDQHLSKMLQEWYFLTEDVAGVEDKHSGEKVKINYTKIPKLYVRGEPTTQLGLHMFKLLGGIIPYLVQFDCTRKSFGID